MPAIDGVFISHAHADHCWNIAFLHKDMPTYCGETCKLFLKAAQESSLTRFGQDFLDTERLLLIERKLLSMRENFILLELEIRLKLVL